MMFPFILLTILLGSSIVLHWGERQVRVERFGAARIALWITVVLGIVFTAIQSIQYVTQWKQLSISSDSYGSIFYTITSLMDRFSHLFTGRQIFSILLAVALSASARSKDGDGMTTNSASYADCKIVYNTLDANTVAADANTGKLAWRTQVGDIHLGETTTGAPLVVNDIVFVGDSGAELGVRGKLTALDAHTGRILWRAYSAGPDSDVRIGPDFKPF